MLQEATLQFLRDLSENNHKEWFHDNKKAYQAAKNDFYELVAKTIENISQFDQNIVGLVPKKCVFRINRDIRFSKNKSPYKTNFGAAMARGGRKSPYGGYYLHLEPTAESFLAGGMYRPESKHLKMIRQEIDYNTSSFLEIVESENFKKHFGEITGDRVKTSPKGYSRDHEHIYYIRLKSFLAYKPYESGKILEKSFSKFAQETFENIKPLNNFLNVAIS